MGIDKGKYKMVVIAIILNGLLLILMTIMITTDFTNSTRNVTIILAVVVPIFNILTFIIKMHIGKPVGSKRPTLFLGPKRLKERQ